MLYKAGDSNLNVQQTYLNIVNLVLLLIDFDLTFNPLGPRTTKVVNASHFYALFSTVAYLAFTSKNLATLHHF